MPNEKPTEKQMALVNALTDLILEYSIEEILQGVSTLCRMGEDNHNST
jgi:hypothetical protein